MNKRIGISIAGAALATFGFGVVGASAAQAATPTPPPSVTVKYKCPNVATPIVVKAPAVGQAIAKPYFTALHCVVIP